MTNEKTLTHADLLQFSGRDSTNTDLLYRHSINQDVHYTDGAKYVAETGGVFWLLDEIAVFQSENINISNEGIQVWMLLVDTKSRTGTLTCEDGNGHVVFTKEVEHTDFPLPELTLWCSHNVISLPDECY